MTPFKRRALLPLIVMLSIGGCGGNGGSPRVPDPVDCPNRADTTQAATVSYASDIRPIMERNTCTNAGCHGGLFGSSGYSVRNRSALMTAGQEARALLMCAVLPGVPDSSYLVWKLEGRSGIQGDRMPQDRSRVSAADIAKVKTWILEGARNN